MDSLLGLQLRQAISNLPPWSDSRRQDYLLQESIERPLSVDPAVWPRSTNDEEYRHIFRHCSDIPEATSPQNGLEVFFPLDQRLVRTPYLNPADSLIALTASTQDAGMLAAEHNFELPYESSETLSTFGWTHLGYDIADEWLTSGLMNCSYHLSSKAHFSLKFATCLNQHGLFTDRSAAIEFCEETNTRVREHAPFLVFGLWKR